MNEFDSLTLALEDWFDRPLGDLPDVLRLRAAEDLAPLRWEELAPQQRRTATLQLDYQHDPATEREREYWWDFFHRKTELEAELQRLGSSGQANLDELLGTGGQRREIRTQIEKMNTREHEAKTRYYPQRRVPVQDPVPGKYTAYPKALRHLRQRLGATPEELAAWVWFGPQHGGLTAYLNVNELDPPPQFYFGELPIFGTPTEQDADYVSPLMGCWF